VLPPLPQAEQEANDIAALFAARAFVGDAATKQAVLERLPSARLVHLATHGLMERDKDRAQYFDAIALGPTSDDAGFLAVREIGALHLNAELVVLSACDSADGKPAGDSVLGFSSAFLAAGVPSLVVAQWSIPDAPTALLMRAFYAGLLHGLDKARALRQAMLVTMKTHPQPGDWAAFTLIGEPTTAPELSAVKGNSAVMAGSALAAFVLPPGEVTSYLEFERSGGSGRMATFMTALSLGEVLAFYRKAYTRSGLNEDARLTNVDARTASMVLAGAGHDRLLVSVVEFEASADGSPSQRSVTLSFEAAR
jgi:hypothetical protein